MFDFDFGGRCYWGQMVNSRYYVNDCVFGCIENVDLVFGRFLLRNLI